ncbi:hypothetical protein IC757_04025 [Wenzhouxiangella sp. AB-CW3]|uniref:Mur ligase family protein n=1 Tax=Wenzhouxiangella sp. AB-CW3 TaxID=2771012 RepID=UPI00168BAE27|nr:Mur ligase family protein [Wenzhouxiangella sp. AB-CW3]QOC23324.1 hypothetical protein IC757_04025 [Wenzhouxiangella sp. AB-CW3]
MQETLRLSYFGPNRRCDCPAQELTLELSVGQAERLAGQPVRHWQAGLAGLHPVLSVDAPGLELDGLSPSSLATLFAGTALALQQAAGHQVSQAGLAGWGVDHCRFWFEFEEPDTAEEAVELTRELLTALLDAKADMAPLVTRIDEYLARARPRAMPADSLAIQGAALARGIPVARMDRPPFDPIRGDFRLRPNGLLRLGHGRGQHTVDGTFAVSRSEPVVRMVHDRAALFERLVELDLPLPKSAPTWVVAANRAGRQAESLGYPVVIRSDQRGGSLDHSGPCHSREEVSRAVTGALRHSRQVLVQRPVDGRAYEVLVAGGRFLACLVQQGAERGAGWRSFGDLHDSTRQLAERLAESLDVGLLQISVITPDPARPLDQANGAIVDVELAPRLDRLLPSGHTLMKQAAEAFVDWLFPEPASARVPIIAVTGTNGKTTTTRLLSCIAAAAGYRAGEATSEGCWVAGEKVSEYEDGHIYGHMTVLDHPATEFAVLESTRGAVATTGLGYARCDVAICLNVTADHLGDFVGLNGVADLAEVKRRIVDRADRAVVLNADNPHCLAMTEEPGSRRVGLVSLSRQAEELLARVGAGGAVAVLETVDGREWLVLHAGGQRIALMAVEDLPIAFGGSARFNLENALHAALAAWMIGVTPEVIARGLAALETGSGGVLGRLNFREDLSFRVCMDYAHNPAGLRALAEFVDRQPISGRRILCFSANNGNTDEVIRAIGEAAAGRFDAYVCKNFGLLFGREPHEGPHLLREGLIRGGVDPACIECVYDEFEAFDQALNMGRPGDLVVLIGGKRRQALWDRVMSFQEVA